MTIRDSEIQIFKSRKLSFEEDTEEKLNNYAQQKWLLGFWSPSSKKKMDSNTKVQALQ